LAYPTAKVGSVCTPENSQPVTTNTIGY
jgi:hypothetical protein